MQVRKERIPFTSWGTKRRISWLEKEAELKEKIADKLKNKRDEIANQYSLTDAIDPKESSNPWSHNSGHYTHTQRHLVTWRDFGRDLKKGGIMSIPLYAVILAFHSLGFPFIAPISAWRAWRRDPDIFFKRIAGQISLSDYTPDDRRKLVDSVASSLRTEASDIRGVTEYLKAYNGQRYGREAVKEKKTGIDADTERISGSREWRLEVGRHARRFFERQVDHAEHAEEMIGVLKAKRQEIIDGRVAQVPASKPHLWYYNAHLEEIRNKPAAEREGHLQALIDSLEEIARNKESMQSAKKEIDEFVKGTPKQYATTEEKQEQKLQH